MVGVGGIGLYGRSRDRGYMVGVGGIGLYGGSRDRVIW
jgi:hypothetical protein